MSKVVALLSLACTPLLFGCNEYKVSVLPESDSTAQESVQPPRNDSGPSTDTTDSTDSTDTTVNTSPSYIISEDQITSRQIIQREELEGFRVDDIYLKKTSDTTITIDNRTPRIVKKPIIVINKQWFTLNSVINPFERLEFATPELVDDIALLEYMDEQPLMKVKVNYFEQIDPSDDKYGTPDKENIEQYIQEILGLKSVTNDFDFINYFIEFINAYGQTARTRSSLSEHVHDEACGWSELDTTARTLTPHYVKTQDTASPTEKLISMVSSEPSARYRMLLSGANGVATTSAQSNGFLAVRDFRLYQDGQVAPKTTYFHEKMHNHGFGHSGGMTYGIPARLGEYVTDGYWNSYYDADLKAQETYTVALEHETVFTGNPEEVELHIQFIDKNVDLSDTDVTNIEKLIISMTNNIELVEIGLKDENGEKQPITTTSEEYDNNKILIYKNMFKIPTVSIATANQSSSIQKLYLRIKRPEMTSTPNMISSSIVLLASDDSGQRVQANKIIPITPELGTPADNNQIVFYEKSLTTDDDGYYNQAGFVKFTPEEGKTFCEEKGYTLGTLPPYKSKEMMDFQMKYQPYASQVGLSYETGLPVAVSVGSSYKESAVIYADTGTLIVCQG